MARARIRIHRVIPVIFRSLVLIADNHRNRRAQRVAKLGTRLDFHAVFLVARRCQRALPGPPPGHLRLNIIFRKSQARRAPVDDAADRAAV